MIDAYPREANTESPNLAEHVQPGRQAPAATPSSEAAPAESRLAECQAQLKDLTEQLERERAGRKLLETDLTRLGLVAEKTQNAVIITDASGLIQWVNKGFTRITGYTPEEVRGRKPGAILQGPLTDQATVGKIRAALGRREPFESEIYNYGKSGRGYWLSIHIAPIQDAAGELQGFIAIEMDITRRKQMEEALQRANEELEERVRLRTAELELANGRLEVELRERRQAEASLRESEERYALAARGANDGLWDWDLQKDDVYYSDRWKEILGCKGDAVTCRPDEWWRRVHPDDAARVQTEFDSHRAGRAPHLESEHRMLHGDGDYRWVLCRGVAVRNAAGRPVRMAGSLTDITTRKRAEEQLLHNAFHDALTGLPNRTLFVDHLKMAMGRAGRRGVQSYAVLFLDLDRFKVINDSLGHVFGDKLLEKIAGRVKSCVRPGDTVARLGGDEFTVLLEDLRSAQEAVCVAERIQEELSLHFDLGGHEVFTSVSIGIAMGRAAYEKPEEVLRDADTAMYRAKAQGKARHELFDQGMHDRARELLRFETDLRRAMERGEFRLHYQPIMHIGTGELGGFEALLRWQHPELGQVSPDRFIPVAEDTGLIVPIGYWVLREACRQMRAWQDCYPQARALTMAVNLSCKQFMQADLIEHIGKTLSETGLAAQNLKLEITESAVMENEAGAAAMLARLRDMGIELSIDDFGTGYSSLSYLHRFPVSTLKIDRSFISRMCQEGEGGEIIRTVVTLARNLGMQVVAEGVETGEQLERLKALDCAYGQGYLFSKPVSGEEVAAIICGAADQRGAPRFDQSKCHLNHRPSAQY